MNGNDDDSRPAPSRWRFRFSLLALFVLTTLVAILLAWWVQPNRVVATALFEVGSTPSTVFGDARDSAASEREYDILKKTQVALLRSNYVLDAAIRNPKIAAISILQEHEDPVEWLQNDLDVSFPQDGEILEISLRGTESQSADLVAVVNAVAQAYKDEVINERRQRQFARRDLLARGLENLSNEIQRKMTDFTDIARESGSLESGSGRILQELDMKRLDRVEEEIARLENQLVAASEGNGDSSNAIEQRLSQLHKRQDELEKKLVSRADRSTDLEVRQHDVEQLQRIADQMSQRLEQMDVEASGMDRIRQVQQAVASPE